MYNYCKELLLNRLYLRIAVIMEYLVKINRKARILELKRRNMKITDLDIQYAVSIKEDVTYPCLHFTKYHEELKSNTPYPYSPIRRTRIPQYNIPGRSIRCAQEVQYTEPEEPNTPYPGSRIRRIQTSSRKFWNILFVDPTPSNPDTPY
ncbi:hypothetical protein Tco_0677022 [Tanacetum coccineum]